MFAGLIRHRATVYLMVVCVLVFGTLTYRSLPREAQPDVDIPFVMVTTVYAGVSPADVESLLTVPVENELAGLKDLKKMTSTSAEGVSMVALEFEPEVDIADTHSAFRTDDFEAMVERLEAAGFGDALPANDPRRMLILREGLAGLPSFTCWTPT